MALKGQEPPGVPEGFAPFHQALHVLAGKNRDPLPPWNLRLWIVATQLKVAIFQVRFLNICGDNRNLVTMDCQKHI